MKTRLMADDMEDPFVHTMSVYFKGREAGLSSRGVALSNGFYFFKPCSLAKAEAMALPCPAGSGCWL
jgi:hypothetical protein